MINSGRSSRHFWIERVFQVIAAICLFVFVSQALHSQSILLDTGKLVLKQEGLKIEARQQIFDADKSSIDGGPANNEMRSRMRIDLLNSNIEISNGRLSVIQQHLGIIQGLMTGVVIASGVLLIGRILKR